MAIFDKYQEVMGPRPNGRPVGVRDGFGQQPQQVMNPALSGMTRAPGGVVGGPIPGVTRTGPLPTPFPAAPPQFMQRPPALQSINTAMPNLAGMSGGVGGQNMSPYISTLSSGPTAAPYSGHQYDWDPNAGTVSNGKFLGEDSSDNERLSKMNPNDVQQQQLMGIMQGGNAPEQWVGRGKIAQAKQAAFDKQKAARQAKRASLQAPGQAGPQVQVGNPQQVPVMQAEQQRPSPYLDYLQQITQKV